LAAGLTNTNSYTKVVQTTGVVKAHDKLSPFRVKVRESRDSAAHPNSNAVVVVFDVTGSMNEIPVTLQKKLGGLMALLVQKGWLEDPQIMFAATGDANSDRVPLQVGQFESDVAMDDDLSNIYLEGGGGGQRHETYELAAYFLANHTSIDCFEKRGKKGYLFFIGDEMPYDQVNGQHVAKIIGGEAVQDLSTEKVFKELSERYELFCLIPEGAQYSGNAEIRKAWGKYVGNERVIILDDPSNVSETIATTIGLTEGKVNMTTAIDDLRDVGVTNNTIDSVTKSLVVVSKNVKFGNLAKVDTGKLAKPTSKGNKAVKI
jgi:hypothetical protein